MTNLSALEARPPEPATAAILQFEPDLRQTAEAINSMRGFIPSRQLELLGSLCRGEEGGHFRSKLVLLAGVVSTMAKTYEQDGKGDDATASLHYFSSGCDWYITEKDMEAEQHQAFGLCDMGDPELGYVSLVELCKLPEVEIDLYWEPKTLGEIKKGE